MPAARSILRRWRRFAAVFGITLLLAGVAAYFAAMPVFRAVLREKLQALVSDYLYARLEMGELRYRFPYGVVADDVRLVTTVEGEPSVTLASFKTLYLQLGELPLGGGALVIETIDVDEPALHLVRTAQGIVGNRLVRPFDASAGPRGKLSDVLHLRHVQLSSGRIEYDNRTIAGTVPLVWEHLNLRLACRRQEDDPSNYHFDFVGNSGDLADLAAAGSADVDEWLVALESFTIDARLFEGATRSPLPADVQALLGRFGVTGNVKLEAHGIVALAEPETSRLDATLCVRDGRAVLPGEVGQITGFTVDAEAQVENARLVGRLAHAAGRSPVAGVTVGPVDFTFDPAALRWTLSPIALSADLTPPPPYTALRQPAMLSLQAMARQGDGIDQLAIDLAGTTLRMPAAERALSIAGRLRSANDRLHLEQIAITGLGGQINASGSHVLSTAQTRLSVELQDINAAPLARLLAPAETRSMTGKITGDVAVRLTADDIDTLTAVGSLSVAEGDLGKVPLLAGLARHLGVGEGLFVARDAFLRFTLAHRIVQCEHLNVGTEAFRVRGAGTVGFDRALNLALYASTNSDWRKGMEETKVPLLSDIGGAIAGGAQRAIRSATRQLMSFKVTGTIDEPKITPTPLPALAGEVEKIEKKIK